MSKGTGFMAAGLALILAAGALTVYNSRQSTSAAEAADAVLPLVQEQISASAEAKEKTTASTASSETSQDAYSLPERLIDPDTPMPVVTEGGQDYIGILEIPALELQLPVISEWSYSRLYKAPCRYTGSAYKENMVIAAHNYNGHFGRIKNLQEGDEVYFTDAEGNVFSYTVSLVETLASTDVEEMTSGEWPLTLFTCTVGGRARVTVRCE